MFKAVVNPYGGCSIGPEQLLLAGEPLPLAVFRSRLADSIGNWQSQYQLIWLELNAACATLIAEALAQGFSYHHCQGDSLMLVKKLKNDSYLPLAATHSIGVGALVWSPSGQVLMVKELPLAGQKPGYFKLPGGMVEPKEHLARAVVREVLEETGVVASFHSVLGMRHHHQGQFGASNLYIVCQLFATTTALTPAANEIAEVRWFDVETYLKDENASLYNKLILKSAVCQPQLVAHQVQGYMKSAADYEIFLPALAGDEVPKIDLS
ncbi:NUDIX hydrolase [Rheinheimera sp.]|uniref:NUDIX hydrolase n=1 Tax=Rheinheimera sp. TaxID=1869214 RepID=UPI002FDCB6CF